MKRTMIIILLIIVITISLIYALPRLLIINEFKTEFGKTESYENVSCNDWYLGRYAEYREGGLSVKLPVRNESMDYIITQEDNYIICDSNAYELIIIDISNEEIDCYNTIDLDYECINEFEIFYLGIDYDDMKFFKPIHKLKYYREKYEFKYKLLEELGPKYSASHTNENYEVVAMFNDSIPNKSNFNILSIIIYQENDGTNLSPYIFVQVKSKNDVLITEGEVNFIANSLEVLED